MHFENEKKYFDYFFVRVLKFKYILKYVPIGNNNFSEQLQIFL